MTADTLGGVWTYATRLCKALESYNTEVHLMTMGAPLSEEQHRQVSSLNNVFLYQSDYKLEWMDNPWEDTKAATQWITSVYKEVKPHIMHFNNYAQVSGEWRCPVITVFHSCVQTWWLAVKGENAPPPWEKYKSVVKDALFISDCVVAPTAAILADAEKVYGPIARKKIIANGCDITDTAIKKRCRVLSAGRLWDEGKNMILLSRIAADLDWPVLIAGNNENPDTGIVSRYDNVHFIGALPPSQLYTHMAEASIFVMPSKYEPFGLSALEAAKSGCALALSDIDTFREIWKDAAVYFNPDDKKDALRIIQDIIKDDAKREELAHKAFLKANEYTMTRMSEEYMSLYRDLHEKIEVKHLNSATI